MKNIPKRIFLVVGEVPDDTDFDEIAEEVCWCTDKAFPKDVEYVRKDLYDKLKEKYESLKSYTEHPYDCQMGS